ncbi:MAG: aspartate aminotransferase family protein [Bacteroidales bacterium]|jgi:acetylornithine/succinyldiaminopimelate/putrescine aminotransferase|nr:aspartate aminotransferase family protein [Bacteroidales bacterium]
MLNNRQLFLQHLAIPAEVPDALEIVKAEGIFLYDVIGRTFIDLVSGVSVSNIGHRHPKVVKAIEDQLKKYLHLMVYGKYIQSPQVMLAGLMTSKLPDNLQSVFFVNSGSEAIEGALKLAKRVTGRSEIIAFQNAYHGSTSGALSVLGDEEMKFAYRPLLPEIKFLHFNNVDDLEKITSETAAVIIEPIQAEAGILIPDKDYMSALRDKCDKSETILIFDEVQMGFGRTGKLFAFEHFGLVPDILCLAKGMGGGMPIGAFVSSKEHMSTLTRNPALGHITTFGGHPVSCAAALASLEIIIEDQLAENADEKGKMFKKEIEKHEAVDHIRQVGLMLAVEIKESYSVSKLVKILQQNGLIVDQFLFNNMSFRIAPPLTISFDEIKLAIHKLKRSLDTLIKK